MSQWLLLAVRLLHLTYINRIEKKHLDCSKIQKKEKFDKNEVSPSNLRNISKFLNLSTFSQKSQRNFRSRSFMTSASFRPFWTPLPPFSRCQIFVDPAPCQHVSDFYTFTQHAMKFIFETLDWTKKKNILMVYLMIWTIYFIFLLPKVWFCISFFGQPPPPISVRQQNVRISLTPPSPQSGWRHK